MRVLHLYSGNLFGGIESILLSLASRPAGQILHEFALVLDRLVFPDVDLWLLRLLPALLGVAALVFGLIWESDG